MNFRIKRIWVGVSAAIAILGCVWVGYERPYTAMGNALFRLGYSLPSERPSFLRFYARWLRETNGGYVPVAVDEFLVDRLRKSQGSAEWRAILDFHIAQRSGRWGTALFGVEDELKRGIINDLVQRLDMLSDEEAIDTLVFVETLRRGDVVYTHKGGIHGLSTAPHEVGHLAIAKDRFRIWWGDGISWPANKAVDPLQGTGMKAYSGSP